MAGILCACGAALAPLGPIAFGLTRQFLRVPHAMAPELLWLTAVGSVAAVAGFILNQLARRRARRRVQKAAGLL